MQIIPVIDLKDGLVVHAAGGDRNHYKPIHLSSRLCDASKLGDVVGAFLSLYPFQAFYIADLNAITGNGDHRQTIKPLLKQYPHLEFWIDKGGSHIEQEASQAENLRQVIGTESQPIAAPIIGDKQILSLDFKQNRPLGHPDWLSNTSLWSETVIVMTLDLVGAGQGPDFDKLSELCTRLPEKRFVAAGGVRHIDDLLKLEEIGVSAALIASSLHNGAITRLEIEKLHAKKYPGKPGYF